MDRVLEPELMEDEAQAAAYAGADFSASNTWFVEQVIADFADRLREVVDLGCGPADVPLRLARALPAVRVTAVDGSAAMLDLAREALAAAGLQDRVRLLQARMPGVPLPGHAFDAVFSKDMFHHLPDPAVLWHEIRRLARPGAAIAVMDLFRPASPEEARTIVERVAGREPEVLKTDFYNSLRAAFTVEEVEAQLDEAGLRLEVSRVSDRHMWIRGFA